MMPHVQQAPRQRELSADEAAMIRKKEWVDDETSRLLQLVAPGIADFRQWWRVTAVKACREHADTEEAYPQFIRKRACGPAQHTCAKYNPAVIYHQHAGLTAYLTETTSQWPYTGTRE